jgi:hypothetical protein
LYSRSTPNWLGAEVRQARAALDGDDVAAR